MAVADLLDVSLNSELEELPKYLRRAGPLIGCSGVRASFWGIERISEG